MPIYINRGGVSSQLTSIYTNQGGSSKKVISAYANINNVQKQIFNKRYKYSKYYFTTDGIRRYYFIRTMVDNEPITKYMNTSDSIYLFRPTYTSYSDGHCGLDYKIVSNTTPKYFSIQSSYPDITSSIAYISMWQTTTVQNLLSINDSFYNNCYFWPSCASDTDKIIFNNSYNYNNDSTKIFRIIYSSTNGYTIDSYLTYRETSSNAWYKWQYEYDSYELSYDESKYDSSQMIYSSITKPYFFDYNTDTYNSSIIDYPEIGYIKESI